MTMIKRTVFGLALLFASVIVNAQDDFGMWFALNSEFGLFKKVDLRLSGSLRTFNNTSQLEQSFLETGLQYKFARNFSVEGYYRFINNIEDDGNYYYRHRFNLDLNASLPVNKVTFFTRARLQIVSKTYIEDDEDLLPVYAGRLKVGANYLFSGPPLKPYIYFESYTPISPDPGLIINKYRFSVGTVLKITRRISFDGGYVFQRDYKPSLSNIHIISMELNIKF